MATLISCNTPSTDVHSLNGQMFESHNHCHTILMGLNDLRKRGHLFDITLETDGKEFHAHRVLLASCSDYFRAMFTDCMLEAQQRAISLNVPAAGISILLDYIYTSKLQLNLENIQDVLAAANYIQLESVITHCRTYLQSQLDLENCIDILTISETYSLHRLKEKVYRYICSHLYEVSKTTDFCRLTSTQLQYILSSDYPVDCTELNVLKIAINYIAKTDAISEQEQILHHIRYKYTPLADLEVLLTQQKICASSNMYQFVVQSAQLAHKNLASSSNSQLSLTTQNSLLINYRGMELAVIKIGGFDLSGITNEITYCFPDVFESKWKRESKIWKHLTSIPHIKQSNFGTVVLNNQLYVIGGCYDISLQEYIHPFGFRYCPISNKWQTISPMQQDRCRFSLNVINGSLYAVGGVSEVDEEVPHTVDVNISSCEKYNAMLDKWEYIQALPEYRSQHAGATLGTCLFVCGGLDAYGQVLDSFFRFNTTFGVWTKMPDMLGGRTDHVLLTLGNKLYVCGGWYEINSSRVLCNTIEAFDLETEQWTVIAEIPTPKFHAGVVGFNSRIYIIGGFCSDDIFRHTAATIECYNIDTKVWVCLDEYPKNIWEHSMDLLYIPKFKDDLDVFNDEQQRVERDTTVSSVPDAVASGSNKIVD